MMRASIRALWACLALLLSVLTTPAQAHKPSDSYLTLTVNGSSVAGQWDIALRDLDFALGLDANGDGDITWGEVRARHADIAAFAQARLNVKAVDASTPEGSACTLQIGPQAVDSHTDGAYTVMPLQFNCPNTKGALSGIKVDYRLFADIDPQHRGLLSLSTGSGKDTTTTSTRTAVLGPQAPQQSFVLAETSRWRQFLDYAQEGVWHIWIGFDHILFLLSLLLPAVLIWQPQPIAKWLPAARFKDAFFDVLRIVTAFTVAHSITLSLATLGYVTLPSRVVESAIAASVVLAALNNVFPMFQGRRWAVAFAFGLIHGFGFASVLADLGLPQEALALALVGFNIGVEGGQLAIVAVFLPLTYAMRRTQFYSQGVRVVGSLAIAALAAVWLAERLFNLKVLPF
jgi:hypothetical protein